MNELMIKAYYNAKNSVYNFFHKEDGEANIIAVILVLAVVIILAVVFKDNIASIFNSIWTNIFDNLGGDSQNDITVGDKTEMDGVLRMLF